ncbi:protein kinase domain-containing protein [Pyxidicoccus sp. MSG2]|uniref:protein kinase domain-containing protein n=1 Tax=Pyxidicoccus sp. MSG2 TaxID=2996790 RepID=UPI0022708D5A|nr:protein kinase [Pyxidicoccus sp. MSG2]MCY1019034.1 protein kinase [Pyxidicoccus sp. MSG2]
MSSARDSASLIFGRYAVLRRLAVGGMGEIFLARQVGVSGFERPVILKSLLPDMLDHEGSVEMFLDEARVAGRLNHPNVVSLFEVGEWQGTFYIAMEYIEGEDLGRLARHARRVGTPLSPRVSAEIIRDAALGLDHAHHAMDSQGALLELVHRDISPQNIMVRLDGLTKVVDFGVAKAANRATRTRTGVLKGKLRYMSPEQVRNEPLDGRSDQFALGVVLWELCTQRPLVEAENPAQAMQQIVLRSAPRPSSLVEGISPLLDSIILRMLALPREQRFNRCADVARALQAYLDDVPAPPAGEVSAVVTRLVGETVRARMRDAADGVEALLARGPGSNVSCPNCGQATSGMARFCPHCGSALSPQAAAARPEVPAPPEPRLRPPPPPSEALGTDVLTTPGGGARATALGNGARATALGNGAHATALGNGARALPPPPPEALGADAPTTPGGGARLLPPPPPLQAQGTAPPRAATPPPLDGARTAPPAGARALTPPPLLAVAPPEPTTLQVQASRTHPAEVSPTETLTQPLEAANLEHSAQRPTVNLRPVPMEAGALKRKLTVVVVGVEGAEALRRSLGPEEGLEAVGRLLDTAAAAAERHEAEVVQLTEERWCFVFGLPSASRDDPLRAVRCALDVQREVAGLGLSPPPVLRVGMEFDVALVSSGRGRMPWRVTGASLDRAASLATTAEPGEVLATTAVKALLEEEVRFSPAALLEDGPVWRVEGLGGMARATPFVGRAEALVEAARSMTGGARLFTGASGMGKSRFLEAVAERAAKAAPLRVVHARAADPRAAGAMGLVRAVLVGVARELGPSPEKSPLQPLTALGFTEAETAALWKRLSQGGLSGQAQVGDATVAEALQRAARPAGLLLLLDDLHRADGASLELLASAVSGPGARVGLVGTCTPDAIPAPLAPLPSTTLPGLSRVELRALLTGALGAACGAEVERLVSERSQGSPSFALELVRALVERGTVQRLGGTWQLAVSLSETVLPDSLALALGARLDRLPSVSQRFLTRAAVEGSTFSVALVHASLRAEDGGFDVLETLAAEGWLVAVPERPGTFRFALELGRQVLLERLTQSALRKAHQELADTLERASFASEPAREVRIAEHLLAAGSPEAAAACERAGEWLSARGEWRAAAEYLRRAVGEAPGVTASVRAWQLGVLARAAGCLTHVAPAAVEALVAPWLERISPDEAPAAWAELARRQAVAECKLGRVADAEVRLTLAQGLASVDPEAEAWVLGDRARAREVRGDATGAVELLFQAFQRMGARPARAPDFYWEHLNMLGRLQHRLGQTDRARTAFSRACEQARAVGSTAGQARALSNLAGLRMLAGEPAAAMVDLERALVLAEQAGDIQEVARIHYNVGRLLGAGGRAPEARERLERARERARVAGWREGEALTAQALGVLEQRAPRR